MFETRFFYISRLLKEYGEYWAKSEDEQLDDTQFADSDIVDPYGLIQKLASRHADPLSTFLLSQLGPRTQKQLRDCASSVGEPHRALVSLLVKDLNRVIRETALYDKARFTDVVLSEGAKAQIDQLAKTTPQDSKSLCRLNRVLLEEAYSQELANSWFHLGKLQLVNQKGYEYVKNRNNKYFYLQCLLHGAAKEKPDKKSNSGKPHKTSVFEDNVRDFLIKDLQLLFGMYCFIHPKASDDEKASPYYLLGALTESDLKPSFTFPIFVNTRNIRNSREFHKLPDEWLAFYLHVNTITRANLIFKDDFVKFFGDQDFRRNDDLEKENNIFYASSGEIDHTILQWLFCALGSELNLEEPFRIPINKLFPDQDTVAKCLNSTHGNQSAAQHAPVIDKIISRFEGQLFLKCRPSNPVNEENAEARDPAWKIHQWLQCFGLLNDTGRAVPTERLLAAIEFFYFHLKSWEEKKIGKNTRAYFRLRKDPGTEDSETKYYADRLNSKYPNCTKAVRRFIKLCELNLPVRSRNYGEIRDKVKGDETVRDELKDTLSAYLKVLQEYERAYRRPTVKFADYGRFNVLSHFFQRNVLPIYNPKLKEQTCRGFVIIPIFSNPHKSTTGIEDVGYFLGLIKDSDAKGRCYFNWRTHSDNETQSQIGDFFYNEYLFHLQNFIYNLGFKEVKQIYYKGIEETAKNEIRRQASRAAISQVMARNMSHNIGSHVLSRYKTPNDFGSEIVSDSSQYRPQLQINPNLAVQTQRAYFNEYLRNRMDFLADIATTDPTLESPLYLVKDVVAGFDKNRILLDRISGLDSGIEFEINIFVRDEDGLREIKNDEDNGDPLMAMPNDILGCQAFYIILENIIRNVTKHSSVEKKNDEESLFFAINVVVDEYKKNTGYYEVSIYDSFHKTNKEMEDLVAERNQMIASPVLDEKTNKLREKGLGSIEMLVCAAYLRRVPLDSIESDYPLNERNYKERDGAKIPNILYAYAQPHPTDSGESALGYKFFVRVPQKVLLFDDKNSLGLSDTEKRVYGAKGITITQQEKFLKRPDWEYSHEFLLWLNDEAAFESFYQKHKSTLPQRILNKRDFDREVLQNLDHNAWATYLWRLFRRKNVKSFRVQYSNSPKKYLYPPDASDGFIDIFIDGHDRNWERYENKPDIYYEMCCSHHRLTKLHVKSVDNRMRYLETVVTKIIIIDERIQANLEGNKYNNRVPKREYFERMGVSIPTKEDVNLNQLNFNDPNSNVQVKLADYIKARMASSSGPQNSIITGAADFCVLHLGIIEKLCGGGNVSSEAITAQIKSLVGADNLDKVVITTGRGKPTNISDKFRYVPLAIIQNCVETLFDKGMLVASLYNARRSK
ncbi:MAG: hypothetical protein WAQ99_11880 [Pyrinomonadaceae bacterium]